MDNFDLLKNNGFLIVLQMSIIIQKKLVLK